MQALTDGQSYSIAGLTVTAQKALNATEVAAAFQAGVTSAGNYTVSGSYSAPATWTAGSFGAAGAVLTLTNGATGDVTNFTTATGNGAGGSPTDAGIVETQGAAAGAGVSGTLTINKMANAGTLEITAAGSGVTVGMTDATGTADSLNLKIANAGSIDVGTISTAGVESIALALDDTSTKAADITAVHTLSIADTSLTSIVLTGDAGAILTTNSNKVATIDGSALTLSLTAGSLTTATVAATITGGAGDDILTANHSGDKLIGGAGDDVLKIGGSGAVFANGVTLTGGAGADTFDISGGQTVATVNDYATITDFSAGDMLKLVAANLKFVASSVTTGGTAVFQDLVNKVVLESDQNEAGWFQYQGDTYVVEHRSNSASTSFVNGTDNIVKITGAVDLSNVASYSTSADTLLIIG
jgi:S-layer protein